MVSALALTLLGLFQADAVNVSAAPEAHALVVVALPKNAHRAIVEALHRLRGEATAVGFEVRFVEAGTAPVPERLDSLGADLHPAAVVALAPAADSDEGGHSLDAWFLDRERGTTSVARLSGERLDDADADRADVVLAVRVVDFIRARMFDALVGRQSDPADGTEPARSMPRRVETPHDRRAYVALGADLLGCGPRFSLAWMPQVELGYEWIRWSRLGITAFGLGTRAEAADRDGTVSLGLRGVALNVTWLGPAWRRLRPAIETGVGEYWVEVRGRPAAGSAGIAQTTTKSSPGAITAARISFELVRHWFVELHGGAIWLQSQVRVDMTDHPTNETYVGSVGSPLWMAGLRFAAAF